MRWKFLVVFLIFLVFVAVNFGLPEMQMAPGAGEPSGEGWEIIE